MTKLQNSTFDGEVNYQPQNIIIILIYFLKKQNKKRASRAKIALKVNFVLLLHYNRDYL